MTKINTLKRDVFGDNRQPNRSIERFGLGYLLLDTGTGK